MAWLPACSCGLLLPEYNGVLSHPAAWTLPSCPPCAMLCPPRRQLLTHWTAQHRVLGQKDALALTLLWELGRSAPELAGPQITTVKEFWDIESKGRKRLSSPKQYSPWGPPLNRA